MDDRIRVEGVGPKDAKIALVGESLGETEEKKREPFVGLAGSVLNGILEEVGIKREDCYITNLYKYRPPNNELAKVDKQELTRATDELVEELMLLRPNVIVPLGEYALRAVTGKKGITKWRGSILDTTIGKVIPSIHPSAVSREWTYRPLVVVDFKRILVESTTSAVTYTSRELYVQPSLEEILSLLYHIEKDKLTIAFDVEVETRQICCISIATSSVYSMCIPFWFGASGSMWSEEDEEKIWKKLKAVLENPAIPKVAQNASYDMTVLRDLYGISVRGLYLDTMIAFHSVYPELPKGLDLLCSVYTDVPYYKYQRTSSDMLEFFRYNAMDSAVTFECAAKINKEMNEFGMEPFYREYMHSLIEPLMDITSRGVLVDTIRKKALQKELTTKLEVLLARLQTEIGHPLNPSSPKQVMTWLYDELKYPRQTRLRKDKGIETDSVDGEILEKFYAEYKHPALSTILDIRETKKLLSTYVEAAYDKEADGTERARTSYLITGTETGRLSSRATIWGTGTNLQNIPKGRIRDFFIPDPGRIFLNADLSQAEARIVAYLAGEARLIEVFNNGGDVHRKNACNIFRKPEDEVTTEEREMAKRVVHASNYGMGPVTFAKTAGISVSAAKELLNKYFQEYPRIKLWHMSVEAQLKTSRTMITPFGRRRTFFNRWDSSMLKEAYAYVPQSTVADILNTGLRRLYVLEQELGFQILLQIHDAVLLQTTPDRVDTLSPVVKRILEIPVTINNKVCTIPVDISIGHSWNKLEKV